MYKYQLSPYDLMVVSKYFESIDDFINMEIGIPKAKGNMSKFHFNPIPLDTWSRTLFTSLETLHLYSEEDNKFETEQFYRRTIHYPVKYSEDWAEKKKENEEQEIEELKELKLHKTKQITKRELPRLLQSTAIWISVTLLTLYVCVWLFSSQGK